MHQNQIGIISPLIRGKQMKGQVLREDNMPLPSTSQNTPNKNLNFAPPGSPEPPKSPTNNDFSTFPAKKSTPCHDKPPPRLEVGALFQTVGPGYVFNLNFLSVSFADVCGGFRWEKSGTFPSDFPQATHLELPK